MRVVLFGDSHADQWSPALIRLAERHHWRLRSLTKSSCPPFMTPRIYNLRLQRPYAECREWQAATVDTILALRPDLVVVGLARSVLVDSPGGVMLMPAARWGRRLHQLMATFSDAGIPVVLLADTPWMEESVPDCLAQAAAHAWMQVAGCGRPRPQAVPPEFAQAARDAVAGIPMARLVDLTSSICDSVRCPPIVGGLVVYRDQHHLAARFSAGLAPVLDAALGGPFAPAPAARHRVVGRATEMAAAQAQLTRWPAS